MKKFLLAALVIWASLAGAQSIPTTPNINLYVPYHGTPNWDTYMNANMNFLDSFLSGGTPLNLFRVGQYIDFSAITAPTPPTSPFCRFYYDIVAGQMTGINSLGAPCSSSGGGGGGGSVVAPGGAGTPLAYFPDGTAANVTGDGFTSDDGAGNITVNSLATAGAGGIGLLITPSFQIVPAVFSTLLTCDPSLEGYITTVTDSSSNVLGATITGFGAFHVIGYCDGTNWTVISGAGWLASPAFTGTPTAPTAAVDTSTTQLATTLFVTNQAASATPLIDGTAAVGTSKRYARADHVHPTDTTRAPLASPTFTGTVTLPLMATSANCAAVGTAANPSVASCSAAPAGSFSCATAASTGTCVVNTTAVTANSEIFIQQRSDTVTGTRLSVTCNTGVSTVLPDVTAVSAGVSFTINLGTVAVNPECFSYNIVN